ncbi:MAG TPA: DUF2141 domain-containing protein [Bacteroidales bacterium]
MNKSVVFIICLISISNCAFSQFRLEIEILELRNCKGNIMLQLLDANQKVLTQERCTIANNKCSVSVPDLSPGKYAIRYYHDENMNGKMETNLVGKPTEGYGFSNNVIGKFGPPPFEKWLFEISGDKKIVLKPKY